MSKTYPSGKPTKIAPINLVKASAWAAHHEYLKEMKQTPKDRKTKEAKEEK